MPRFLYSETDVTILLLMSNILTNHSFFSRIREWFFSFSKQTKYSIAAIAGIGIVLCGVAFFFMQKNRPLPSTKQEFGSVISPQTMSPPLYHHPLTGEIFEQEVSAPVVFGVMVENSADSWPQSGLDGAFLVIEAPVEAGIPRFLAFYDGANVSVKKIGPVRSARPYYVDWVQEFEALYAHVGGSDAALNLISSNGTHDLNEFWNGQFFWRSSDRKAPHNTYTSTERLQQALEQKKQTFKTEYSFWNFKDDAPNPTEKGKSIIVDFSSPLYRVVWNYDEEKNMYARLQAGHIHSMQDGKVIEANNVVIVVTSVEIIDAVGRRKIQTIGEGDAFIF